MLSSLWTAPADLCGRGAAARPSSLGVVPVVQGSGLAVAGMAPRLRDGVAIGTGFRPALTQQTAQNDGTTLGNHSPGRPRS